MKTYTNDLQGDIARATGLTSSGLAEVLKQVTIADYASEAVHRATLANITGSLSQPAWASHAALLESERLESIKKALQGPLGTAESVADYVRQHQPNSAVDFAREYAKALPEKTGWQVAAEALEQDAGIRAALGSTSAIFESVKLAQEKSGWQAAAEQVAHGSVFRTGLDSAAGIYESAARAQEAAAKTIEPMLAPTYYEVPLPVHHFRNPMLEHLEEQAKEQEARHEEQLQVARRQVVAAETVARAALDGEAMAQESLAVTKKSLVWSRLAAWMALVALALPVFISWLTNG